MSRLNAKEVLQAMVAMFASGDPSAAAEVVAPDYLDHQGLGSGSIRGVEGFAQVVRTNHAAYERPVISVEDLFGADDRAAARIRWRGRRHDGEEVDRETIDIIRVADGQAVEHWAHEPERCPQAGDWGHLSSSSGWRATWNSMR